MYSVSLGQLSQLFIPSFLGTSSLNAVQALISNCFIKKNKKIKNVINAVLMTDPKHNTIQAAVKKN